MLETVSDEAIGTSVIISRRSRKADEAVWRRTVSIHLRRCTIQSMRRSRRRRPKSILLHYKQSLLLSRLSFIVIKKTTSHRTLARLTYPCSCSCCTRRRTAAGICDVTCWRFRERGCRGEFPPFYFIPMLD